MRKTFVFKFPPEVKFNDIGELINFFGQSSHIYIGNNDNEATLIYFWKLVGNSNNSDYDKIYDKENNRISLVIDVNDNLISHENAKSIRFILFLHRNSFQYNGCIDVKNDKNYYFLEFDGNNKKPVVQRFENEEEFNKWYNVVSIRFEMPLIKQNDNPEHYKYAGFVIEGSYKNKKSKEISIMRNNSFEKGDSKYVDIKLNKNSKVRFRFYTSNKEPYIESESVSIKELAEKIDIYRHRDLSKPDFIVKLDESEKICICGVGQEKQIKLETQKGKVDSEEEIESDSVPSEIEKNVPKEENYKTDEEKNKDIEIKEQLQKKLEEIKESEANLENSISERKKIKDSKIFEIENLNQKIEIAKKIIIPVITLTIIFIFSTLLIFGLFTGGVAPAVLTPLIAKCLIGVFGGIGLTGFFTTLLIACLVKKFRNERDAKQNEIDDIQKEINPTEQEIEELQTEKNKIESDIKKIESASKNTGNIDNGPAMLKNENEYENE